MAPLGNPDPLLLSQATPYQIEQSLRFIEADNNVLTRNVTTEGNRTTWTFSCWVKRCELGQEHMLFSAATGAHASNPNITYLSINSSERLVAYTRTNTTTNFYLASEALLRDPSAWYHIVWEHDTTQSTAADRIKLYVNGVQITEFNTNTTPSQNYESFVNNTVDHTIGEEAVRDRYGHEGYLAEIHFVDGTALDATSFGEFDDNGVWRPIQYTGSHGSQGYYLKFDPSATNGIGHDHSGNGNNFTPTGFTTSGTGTDVMSDTPTTNYCTLNPIGTTYGFQAPTDGNLKTDANAYSKSTEGTFGIPKDGNLYYFEGTMTRAVGDGGTGLFFGCHTQGHTTDPNNSSGKYFGTYGTDGSAYDGAQFIRQYGTQIGSAKYGHINAGTVLAHAIKYDSGTWKYWYRQGSNGWHYWNGSSWVYNTSFDETEPTGSSSSVPESETLVPIGSNIIFNFGQRDFEYTPPTDAKYLRSSDLPEPEIANGSANFNTVLYTGNGVNNRSIPNVGFQPDFVWVKNRSDTDGWSHILTDAVRGGGPSLQSANSQSEYSANPSGYVSAFNSDGFVVTEGDTRFANTNASSASYVSWNWLGGNGTSTPSGASISSTVSANPTAGFSIVSYTGTGTAGTVAHGLGVAPSMIIEKNRDRDQNWAVYHSGIGATKALILDETYGEQTATYYWNDTAPTSSVFSVGTWNGVNDSTGQKHIAYCFAEVEGYSKFGYVSGLNNDEFVYLGFSPAWIMFKRTSTTSNWAIRDSKRDTYNISSKEINADTNNAENTFAALDFLSNGFKARSFTGVSGGWIYAAFAEHPFGGSGVSPATAR